MNLKQYSKRRSSGSISARILIAGAVDYRGENDDVLVFVFRGASHRIVTDVFRFLVGRGEGIAAEARVVEEHDCIRRNGMGYWRIAVYIEEPNFRFCSLDDMCLLIESAFSRMQPCSFSWFPIHKFLNI